MYSMEIMKSYHELHNGTNTGSQYGVEATAADTGIGYTFNSHDLERNPEELLKPYNPTVMNVFLQHADHPENRLLGAVGDLNNLGVHVATRGRAAAENLVDLYNQAIRNSVNKWAMQNGGSITALTFVPSGEEVLILASVNDKVDSDAFFRTIHTDTDTYMNNQKILDIGGTSACFGCTELTGYEDKLNLLKDAVANPTDDDNTARLYFEVLSEMRTAMADQLDVEKFADRLEGSEEDKRKALALRRLAWAGMLAYKENVHGLIKAISEVGPDPEVVKLFDQLYGCIPALPNTETHVSILKQAGVVRDMAASNNLEM